MVDYLVVVKIYNAYFGKLVLYKCSEFINIYYCEMQHKLLHRVPKYNYILPVFANPNFSF